jgi:S-adenosylmethionine hydrolase
MHGSREPTIALLTDFGTRDVYVGAMKGVITRIAPQSRLLDLTHEVPAGGVREAAFRLWQALPFMPQGTVFLAVVDPGVGTSRRAIAAATAGFCCVGPDNGLFTYLLAGRKDVQAVELEQTSDVSVLPPSAVPARRGPGSTFHGRDIFAPAAGLLASGRELSALGRPAGELVRIPYPLLELDEGGSSVRGEVICRDGFGNLITSIGILAEEGDLLRLRPWLPTCRAVDLAARGLRARVGDRIVLPLARTFAGVPPGSPLAYIGSDGLLEIGVNQGSAAELLGLASGALVRLS